MNDIEPPFREIPPEIKEAARKVELWFEQQGIHKWALFGIQSRSEPDTYADMINSARLTYASWRLK